MWLHLFHQKCPLKLLTPHIGDDSVKFIVSTICKKKFCLLLLKSFCMFGLKNPSKNVALKKVNAKNLVDLTGQFSTTTFSLELAYWHVIRCLFCRQYLWMGHCLKNPVRSLEAPVACGPKLNAGTRRPWWSWRNARTSWQQSCEWVNTENVNYFWRS